MPVTKAFLAPALALLRLQQGGTTEQDLQQGVYHPEGSKRLLALPNVSATPQQFLAPSLTAQQEELASAGGVPYAAEHRRWSNLNCSGPDYESNLFCGGQNERKLGDFAVGECEPDTSRAGPGASLGLSTQRAWVDKEAAESGRKKLAGFKMLKDKEQKPSGVSAGDEQHVETSGVVETQEMNSVQQVTTLV
eukprot:g16883.t1